jgi:hypothetical protein
MARRSTKEPSAPWVPANVSVFPIAKGTTKERPRGSGATRIAGKERPCWDVRFRVDGRDFLRRFSKAGDANAWADDLVVGLRQGLLFDPAAKRFIEPDAAVPATGDSLYEWTETYWQWRWPQIEPKTRKELARYLNRVRGYFVTEAPTGDTAVAVDDYLTHASLSVKDVVLTETQRAGQAWLASHSTPIGSIGPEDLDAFLAHCRPSIRFPGRQVAGGTERRMIADLRPCWERAVYKGKITSSPWDRLDPRDLGGRRTSSSRSTAGVVPADAELVLSGKQVFEFARICVELGGWGSIVLCFVLVMGLCGLRPSEAVGLVVGDLELPDSGGGWLTVRRSRRKIQDRWLDDEDDPEWGPLKGRELTAIRRVPIPTKVVQELRKHLERHCAGAAQHDLVFHRDGKAFDVDAFDNDIWRPARGFMFPLTEGLAASSPLQPKLSRLRRQDLRHSACSAWLRSKVDVKVCQKWSGHKRLSVFLDIYQGLMPESEDEGALLLDEYVRNELSELAA